MLTLRDPQASKVHPISPEGAIIGREGGDADIIVRNASVSKRHARLFNEQGEWWLEDMRSANGTFVDNDRVTKVAIAEGMVFDLAGYRFEVMSITSDGDDAPEDDPDGSARTFQGNMPVPQAPSPSRAPPRGGSATPARTAPPRRPPETVAAPIEPAGQTAPIAAAQRPTPVPARDQEQEEPQEEQQDEQQEAEQPPEEQAQDQEAQPPEEPEPTDDAGSTDPGAMDAKGAVDIIKAQLPKAIAYYLVTVPKLLFNPLGTIKKSISDQRFPGIKGLPLISWALPGLATTFAVSLVCSFILVVITAIRGGGFMIGALISSILMVVIGPVVGGLCIAFLYHPVMAFIIKLLKGQSDEKSRTNYLIISQAAGVISAIPSGVQILFAGIALFLPAVVGALLPIIPSLLSLGATLITVALAYHWFKFFKVHKVIPTIILVCGALAALGTLWGVIGAIRTSIASIHSGAPAVAVVDASAAAAAAAAAAAGDDDDAHAAKPLNAAAAKAAADAKKLQAEAAKNAAAAVEAAKAAANKEPEPGDEPAPKKVAKEPEAAPKKATPTPVADEPAPKKAAPTPSPTADAAPTAGAQVPPGATPYQKFAARRTWVENIIAADPTQLHDERLLALFKQFHTVQHEIRKARAGKTGVVAPDDVVTQRLIDADTYEKTHKLVDELYEKLGGQ